MRPFPTCLWPLGVCALALGCSSTPEPVAADPDPRAVEPSSDAAAGEAGAPDEAVDKSEQPAAASPLAPSSLAKRSGDAPKTRIDAHPRIGAIGPHTWIWKKPERKGLAIGKMRIGTSVRLRSPDPVDGPGCKGKWYAIEPRGYVCDDETATLDLEDAYFKVLAFSAPEPGEWPYGYAHSNGAPMYSRIPTQAEWTEAEREYGPTNTWKPLGAWAKGHEELIVDEPIKPTDEVPYFLRGGKRSAPGGNYDNRVLVWKRMPAGSMLAYSRAFEANGRVWLLTPDSMVVPADRMSDMKRSTFRGVHFDETDMTLPFAWNRAKTPLPLYRREASGAFVATERSVAPKSPVEITDTKIERDGWIYYELEKEPGLYIGKTLDPKKQLDVDVTVTRPATKLPSKTGPGDKWIEVRVVPGTLTAYEGLRPVMSTLFSPGKGGPPLPDFKFPDDHSKYATTALGHFPIEWKERVATMSNEKGEPKVLWFTDVPHQQYLKAPLAMHVTYWHEDFGKRKSAECVNISPLDGLWLFGWTTPELPEGWNGIGAGQGNGLSTPIVVSAN
mgnify:CR=1 FL=1